MKQNAVLTLLLIAFIAVTVIVAGCTSASSGTKAVPPVSPETTLPGSAGVTSCGFTTCHGLDLACGTNAPEVCTMEYQLGDRCRQYARCDSSNGSCTLVTDPRFDSCKSCVEQCAAIKSQNADPAMLFECESKC